jgi:hypothetical protein
VNDDEEQCSQPKYSIINENEDTAVNRTQELLQTFTHDFSTVSYM